MFRRCGGFGRVKSVRDDDSTSSSEYGLEHDVCRGDDASSKVSSTEAFLVEIVGAVGLSALAEDVDSFCTISRVSSSGVPTIIHRTKTIANDIAPIWTLKTKSTCIVEFAKATPNEQLRIELCQQTMAIPGANVMEVVGSLNLNYSSLLANGDSGRREYPVAPDKYPGIFLALRFRKASQQDCRNFQELQVSNNLLGQSIAVITKGLQKASSGDHAGDMDFEHVESKAGFGNHTTIIQNGTEYKAYRIRPFPDPDNPEETTYMTKARIQQAAMEPSRNWVEAASGAASNYGSVFLEIIGCDDLPNRDMEFVDGRTDTFVACVYEDNIVRTPIIHDSLNPRWMPWSHRAFEFHIQHPSSILFLGVFDYDDNPALYHNPIGRVVVVPALYEKDTMYTLKYPLYYEDEHRGTLTMRMRIHWHNEDDASKAESFVRPPRFIVNVKTAKAWKTLRYLTRGATDMSDVTIESVKMYASEVKEHWQRFCYFLDVLAHLVLWRGRLPIDSVVFLVGFLLMIECPRFFPSIVMYLVAYALLRNNYYLSCHPSPWSRVRLFASIAFKNHLSSDRNVVILPEVGVSEANFQDRLDKYKALRVSAFLHKATKTAIGVYRIYSKSTSSDISTASSSGNILSHLYIEYLNHVHLVLSMVCKYSRVLRNFVNGRVRMSYKFTIDLLMFATTWALFPYKQFVVKMLLRMVLLAVLGPQNRIIDHVWIRLYYRTKEDLIRDGIPATTDEMKADILSRPNILDPILSSKWVYELGKAGRIVVEDNHKLQAARELLYGKYSESIPAVDSSRYTSVPTSSSFAQPYSSPGGVDSIVKDPDGTYRDIMPDCKIWSHVPSQKLTGVIIPQPAEDGLTLPSEISL